MLAQGESCTNLVRVQPYISSFMTLWVQKRKLSGRSQQMRSKKINGVRKVMPFPSFREILSPQIILCRNLKHQSWSNLKCGACGERTKNRILWDLLSHLLGSVARLGCGILLCAPLVLWLGCFCWSCGAPGIVWWIATCESLMPVEQTLTLLSLVLLLILHNATELGCEGSSGHLFCCCLIVALKARDSVNNLCGRSCISSSHGRSYLHCVTVQKLLWFLLKGSVLSSCGKSARLGNLNSARVKNLFLWEEC